MAETYTLNWYTFTDHLSMMFKTLYENRDYSDVTLVCDDQTQFKANKIVLSASSPVLKKILDTNPSQHPLIYLRGIQSYEMESILQFMYLGEGKLYYERMGELIKVAKNLEVTEISNGMELPTKEDEPKHLIENKIRQRQPRNQISSDAKPTDCPECGKEFSEKDKMVRHYRSTHDRIKYPCNQCDSKFTQQIHLQTHIQSKHEGIKYPCNQCDYQATDRSNLQKHIQRKHQLY